MLSDPSFQLYNSLTRRVEPLELLEPGHLRFYACGPTVYSYAHIGNFRSFLTADLILRTAQAIGWQTTYVSNVTDVGHLTEDDYADAGGEDRMVQALRSKEGERFANVWDLARYYTEVLLEDWQLLNLREPDVRPRATEHVMQQIKAVEQLLEKGHAYETAQGIYFSVESFPDYGKLSGNIASDQLEEARRDLVYDTEKRNPRDFALWKKDPTHLMQWHSPWGWGFPGWHIECSVMSMTYLGEQFDLHTGGEDNIFPHHECEIAQAESITGRPWVEHWVHTRFLQVEGQKMAKSAGNFYTLRDLIAPQSEGGRGIDPLALRLTLIVGQYRKPYNFTFDTLRDNARHVRRFQEALARVERIAAEDPPGDDHVGDRLEALYRRALLAMLDDLNTPEAIAASLEGVRLINSIGETLNGASARRARAWLDQINALLGLVYHETETAARPSDETDPLAEKIEALLAERVAARQAKDYARADAIRDEIDAMGIEVMDSPEGTTWRRKLSV